jgi:hypothetical protein
MTFIGSLIKKGVEINQMIDFDNRTAAEKQRDQLRSLLEKASNTSFGIFYDFKGILKMEDISSILGLFFSDENNLIYENIC